MGVISERRRAGNKKKFVDKFGPSKCIVVHGFYFARFLFSWRFLGNCQFSEKLKHTKSLVKLQEKFFFIKRNAAQASFFIWTQRVEEMSIDWPQLLVFGWNSKTHSREQKKVHVILCLINKFVCSSIFQRFLFFFYWWPNSSRIIWRKSARNWSFIFASSSVINIAVRFDGQIKKLRFSNWDSLSKKIISEDIALRP